MKIQALILLLVCLSLSCEKIDGSIPDGVFNQQNTDPGCEGAFYDPWETSRYVLPFPVGQSFSIGLSHCSGGLHTIGEPDQFAIDFNMGIGTLVTAVQVGTIMFVEKSGLDYEVVNNYVVLRDEEGYFFQYMHLTHNGALVEEGDFVDIGDPIGYSGASGTLNAHLHFVATRGGWSFPYMSYPITFSNTSPNPVSLIEGETYEALPY